MGTTASVTITVTATVTARHPQGPTQQKVENNSHRIWSTGHISQTWFILTNSLTMSVSGWHFVPRRGSKGGEFSGMKKYLLKSLEP